MASTEDITKGGVKKLTAAQKRAADKQGQLDKLMAALEQAASSGRFPLTIAQLAEIAAVSVATATTLLHAKGTKEQLLLVGKEPNAPVALREQLAALAGSDLLLQFIAARVKAKRVTKHAALQGDAKKLISDAGLSKELKEPFAAALTKRLREPLPPALAELIAVPVTPAQIAQRLLQFIESQKQASSPSYPVTKTKLSEFANPKLKPADLAKVFKQPAFAEKVLVCDGSMLGATNTRYMLRDDLSHVISPMVAQAIEHTVSKSAENTAFLADDLGKLWFKSKPAQQEFTKAVNTAIAQRSLGGELGSLRIKKQTHLFRRVDIEPRIETGAKDSALSKPAASSHAAPSASERISQSPSAAAQSNSAAMDFATQFEAAFARLDQAGGRRNFVNVWDLRAALAQFDRAQFDAGLRALRIADRYTMDSASGGTVQLTPEQRQAGFQEGPSLMVYVSRK